MNHSVLEFTPQSCPSLQMLRISCSVNIDGGEGGFFVEHVTAELASAFARLMESMESKNDRGYPGLNASLQQKPRTIVLPQKSLERELRREVPQGSRYARSLIIKSSRSTTIKTGRMFAAVTDEPAHWP